MQEISIDQVMQNAKEWNDAGKSWHFHMLTPDCKLNEKSDKHAFVLEDCTDQMTYVAYSEKRYMQQGEELLRLLHSEEMMGKNQASSHSKNSNIQRVLEKMKELSAKNISWHHHNLFPHCMFNKHSGQWCILFEDTEAGETIETVYDEEPVTDLREIEALYYSQKE